MIDEKEKFQAAENILADKVCEECGKPEMPTKYVADPYDEDINSKIVMRHLCEGCVKDRSDEV